MSGQSRPRNRRFRKVAVRVPGIGKPSLEPKPFTVENMNNDDWRRLLASLQSLGENDDGIQDILLDILKNHHSRNIRDVRSYAEAVQRKKSLNRRQKFRTVKVDTSPIPRYEVEEVHDPCETIRDHESWGSLARDALSALEGLDAETRMMIYELHVQEKAHAAIAEKRGLSVTCVRQRVSRGIARVRTTVLGASKCTRVQIFRKLESKRIAASRNGALR